MKYFPGIKVNMGSWSYVTIKVKFEDLESTFSFSKSLGNPSALDAVMQRNLNENRSSVAMRKFLANQNERFYSALTVANLQDENSELWLPLKVPNDVNKAGIEPGSDELGFFKITSEDEYYILDGQHRAASIISIINPDSDYLQYGDEENRQSKVQKIEKQAPLPEDFDMDAFKKEEIMVIVLNKNHPEEIESRRSFRRLFSNLNRYAKPTDPTTNIILSEDDTFYILTRRLIENFEPFSLENERFAQSNPNILITSNSFNGTEEQFTTLQSLAKMNEVLLSINKFPKLQKGTSATSDVRLFRQDDDDLDIWYKELEKRWAAIFNVFQELKNDRTKMKSHNSDVNLDGDRTDHPFLWPKPQTDIFIKIIRDLMDQASSDDEYEGYIQQLKDLDIWDLRKAPWYPYLLIDSDPNDPNSDKRLRQDDENDIYKMLEDLIRYLVGLAPKDNIELIEFKNDFMLWVSGKLSDDEKDQFWEECMSKKI